MKKAINGSLGFLCLALGFIGVFVPILPTVPFMLLASFFFFRSSEKMHRWLLNHKVFGPPIKDYLENRSLKSSTKKKALVTLWLSLTLSIYLVNNHYIDFMLIFIGFSVSIYLLSLKTADSEIK